MAEIPKRFGKEGVGVFTPSGTQADLNTLLRSLLTDVAAVKAKQDEIITAAATSLAAIAAVTPATLSTTAA